MKGPNAYTSKSKSAIIISVVLGVIFCWTFVVPWICIAVITQTIARERGRSPNWWCFWSLIFGFLPLIPLFIMDEYEQDEAEMNKFAHKPRKARRGNERLRDTSNDYRTPSQRQRLSN